MKRFLPLLFLLVAIVCRSQKTAIVDFVGNFSFAAKGLSTNDAGIGLAVGADFFNKKRLRLRTEGSLDQFIGSKLLYVDSLGRHTPSNPILLSAKAGPEYFFSKRFSLAVLYGYVRYDLYEEKVRQDAFKTNFTGRWGVKNRFLTSLSFTKVLQKRPTHFLGLGFGYRIL